MTNEPPTQKADTMISSQNRRCYNPFPAIFTSATRLIPSLFEKKVAAKHENEALHEQLKSLEVEITSKICDCEELEFLNLSLYETAMPLQANADEMKPVLELRKSDVSECEKLIAEQEERVRMLENELQNVENEKRVLDARLSERKLMTENNIAEWACVVENENQKNCSLQENYNEMCELQKKQESLKWTWEKRIEDVNEVVSGLAADKEKMVKACARLEQENHSLKGVSRRLREEKLER